MLPRRASEPHRLRRHPDSQRGEENRLRHSEGGRRRGRMYSGQTCTGTHNNLIIWLGPIEDGIG